MKENNNFSLDALVRPTILRLSPYSSARDEFSGSEGVFLDANENPFGNVNRYPDPYQKSLKNELSKLKNIPAKNIFLGNGSDEAIDVLYRIFCEPGRDGALIFEPTYGMYEVSANINNVSLQKINLNIDFQIDIDDYLNEKLNTEYLKIIFICSPNNPTGNVINEASIIHILENFNGIVVLDEAYIDFAKTSSWASRLDEYENLVVLQTFSKYWGMAGLRIGMCFASEKIISLMNKVKPPYNISTLNQAMALEKLRNSDEIQKELSIILSEKELMISELKQLDFVEKIFPSDANFILVQMKNPNSVYNYLCTNKIIVRNRNSVVPGCLRITVGTVKENKKLIEVLKLYQP